MVYIKKRSEPQNLTYYRLSTPNADYDGMGTDIKDDIRANMLQEQGSLCAYCMGRVTKENITIEHWIPQGDNRALDLDYRNMLGVCPGVLLEQKTCGNLRGKKALTINPLSESTISTIYYSWDGSIKSSESDINNDLDKTLNLNADLLKANRKQALVVIEKELQRVKADGSWKALVKQYIEKISKSSVKREYYGFLLYFLNRKAR